MGFAVGLIFSFFFGFELVFLVRFQDASFVLYSLSRAFPPFPSCSYLLL